VDWRVKFIDFPEQWRRQRGELLPIIEDTIARGDLMLREQLVDFETHLAAFNGSMHAVGVSNCTDGLRLLAHALDVGPEDEVVTVAHTFIATISPFVLRGATPVFVDIGADHLMDTDQLLSAVTRRTKIIIPVHLNGRTVDMDAVLKVADSVGATVIEDAAQAFGAKGVAEGLTQGKVVVDMSSISPVETTQFAQKINALGCQYLDAPVSGGPAGAEAGTLTVMVGGDEETFNRALPVFEQFGGTIRLCGPVGGGQAVKLVNQLLVAVHTMAASEAAALAVQLGADLATVRDVIGTSFGSSAMLLRNLPRFIERDFSPATPVGLIAKDLSIIHSEAVNAGVPLFLGGLVEQWFLEAKARGWTGEDMSALVKFWDRPDASPAASGQGG